MSGGNASRRRFASAIHKGMLGVLLARMRLVSPCGWLKAYSSAKRPPKDCPHRCTFSRPNARRTVSISATVRSIVQSEGLLGRSEEHTSELQSHSDLVCRLLLEKKNKVHTYRKLTLVST